MLGLPLTSIVQAAGGRLVVRLDEDLKNLDPAYRTGADRGERLRAVGQGLVKFKPGSTEWENDAAAEIKQVDDKTIEFTLQDGLKFTGGYGELTADDVKFSFERFIKPDKAGKKVDYADDWAALDSVEVTGKLTGKIHLKTPSPAVWLIALADGSGDDHLAQGVRGARRQGRDHADRLRPLYLQGMGAARPFHADRQSGLSRARSRSSARSSASRSPRTRPRNWRCRRARSTLPGSTRRWPRTSARRPGSRFRGCRPSTMSGSAPTSRRSRSTMCAYARRCAWRSMCRRSSPRPITAPSSPPMRWRRRASRLLGGCAEVRARHRGGEEAAGRGRAGRRLHHQAHRAQQGSGAGDGGDRAGQSRRDRHHGGDRRAR